MTSSKIRKNVAIWFICKWPNTGINDAKSNSPGQFSAILSDKQYGGPSQPIKSHSRSHSLIKVSLGK